MIDAGQFVRSLEARGVGMYTGVPDSLLESFCACLDDVVGSARHVISANEGNAAAIAIGHHLATGQVSVVYLQNSGLGNLVNPLLSLADGEVYGVPMLLVIGWRGEPGVPDEPQHITQGRVTPDLLDAMNIRWLELDAGSDVSATLDEAFKQIESMQAPVALLVRKGAFGAPGKKPEARALSDMSREEAISCLLDLVGAEDLLVATTGKASRELFEARQRRGEPQEDFLTVGGMGHASSIALGVAMGCPDRRVVCVDGDGALLMHMGALAINASVRPSQFLHVVVNNAAHDSVGGQPTVADRIDIGLLARAAGYSRTYSCDSPATLADVWPLATHAEGPVLIEVRVRCGARPDLGRPTSSPAQNKTAFMRKSIGANGG